MRVLILGAGYVGLPLAVKLAEAGHEVGALNRTSVSQAPGVLPLVGDITNPLDLRKLRTDWDWVVNTISSSKGGAEDYRRVYLQGTRNLIDWLSGTRIQK